MIVTVTYKLNKGIVNPEEHVTPSENYPMVFRYLIHYENTVVTDYEVEMGKEDK